MTQINLQIDRLARLEQGFRRAPEIIGDEIAIAMEESVDLLYQEITTEPPANSKTRTQVYGQPFQSDRQRRWFFANLRSGALKIPYVRTGELIASWTRTIERSAEAIRGRVFTNSPIAPLAQDATTQSKMLTHWKTAQRVVADSRIEVNLKFRAAVGRALANIKNGVS